MKKTVPLVNEDMKRILGLLNDGIIITDEKLIIEYINDAYKTFSGLTDEVIGGYLPDFRPTSLLPQILAKRKPLYNVSRKVGNFESYCDFIPIFKDDDLVGGLVVIKDVVRIKNYLHEIKARDEKITQLDERIKGTFKARFTFQDVIGAEGGLKKTLETCYKATRTDSSVLLIGESGTGKEVIAQSIHNESDRKNYPFVDINCAALPENLLESELFGYAEGAFTGAKKSGKLGLFEIANGGTLFLDEITEMPLNLQTKLLRVLQEKKIRKVGDEACINLNIRVIAATNKNILQLLAEKTFREDLYFRLAVFVINLPPLRERKTDISLFIDKYIEEQQRKKKIPITISNKARQILENYHWPGNVRELKNAIEYACNITDDNAIEAGNLPQNIIKNSIRNNSIEDYKPGTSLDQILSTVEKEVIKKYLSLYGQSVETKKRIAAELSISIATLYNKIRKYKLE